MVWEIECSANVGIKRAVDVLKMTWKASGFQAFLHGVVVANKMKESFPVTREIAGVGRRSGLRRLQSF